MANEEKNINKTPRVRDLLSGEDFRRKNTGLAADAVPQAAPQEHQEHQEHKRKPRRVKETPAAEQTSAPAPVAAPVMPSADAPLISMPAAAPVDVASFAKKIRKYRREQLKPFEPAEGDPDTVRIVPLGGLEEIGKNMTVIEYGDTAVMIDCGQAFPSDDELFGVDVVIPDMSYLEQIRDKLSGVVLTHGHEDHIGCLPYMLRDFPVPVFGTKLAIGLVNGKLKEHALTDRAKLFGVVSVGDVVDFGKIKVEFFRVNHSIPDACGLIIHTPIGIIVHTGDFKIDPTPISGGMIDLPRLSQVGQQGVLLLMSDSTNSERPGYTATESSVGRSFDALFARAEKQRIIIATFASNIHRIQQIVDMAEKTGRKVAVSGRSMVNTFDVAIDLGYLKVPEDIVIDLDEINNYLPEQLVLITTGSQGETMSALSRMAFSDHRKVEVGANDFIIISATPIPGNERMVTKVVNRLLKLGATVIYEKMYEVHVSGHACQEEQKMIMALTKPKFFIPVHGEYKHFMKHSATAVDMGIPRENIVVAENGSIIELKKDEIGVVGSVPAGRIFVDGLGVGDVGSVVLRDRRLLSQDGILTVSAVIDIMNTRLVAGPEVVSKGFVFTKESEELLEALRGETQRIIDELTKRSVNDINIYRNEVREALSKKIYLTMKRSPVILPLIMQI